MAACFTPYFCGPLCLSAAGLSDRQLFEGHAAFSLLVCGRLLCRDPLAEAFEFARFRCVLLNCVTLLGDRRGTALLAKLKV